MFPSLTLMTAIQADRERELDRMGREHRLLSGGPPDPVRTKAVTRTSVAAPSSTTRTDRSNGQACEPA